MGRKCYDKGDLNKIHRSGFSQFKRKPMQKYVKKFKSKNGLKKSMIPTARGNGIKENSKDILEENVEMGMSCSTIIDDKQDKARNNIEGWWRPVSEKEDQGTLSRLNGIKENSKDILEEIIDDKQNKAILNIFYFFTLVQISLYF